VLCREGAFAESVQDRCPMGRDRELDILDRRTKSQQPEQKTEAAANGGEVDAQTYFVLQEGEAAEL